MSRAQDEGTAEDFDSLFRLVEQAEHLTHYVLRALLDSGVISQRELEAEWNRHELTLAEDHQIAIYTNYPATVAARAYNHNCDIWRGHCGIDLTHQLPSQAPPHGKSGLKEWFTNAFGNAEKCFDGLRENLRTLFPREMTSLGRHHFLTGAYRRTITDNGGSRVCKDHVFILVVGGEFRDDVDRRDVWNKILSSVKTIDARRITWDQTPNQQALVACTAHFEPIRSAIQSIIRQVGDIDPDTLDRIVFTVAFGSVTVGTTTDAISFVRDQRQHRSLQDAHGLALRVRQTLPHDDGKFPVAMSEEAWRNALGSIESGCHIRELALRDAENRVHNVKLVGLGGATERVLPPRSYDAFVSFNSKDRELVTEIKERIDRAGAKRVWFDSDQLKPGDRWVAEIGNALGNSNSIVVFIGRNGLGDTQQQEVESAIAKNGRVIPVLLPGGTMPSDIGAFLQTNSMCDMTNGITDALIRDLSEAIRRGEQRG